MPNARAGRHRAQERDRTRVDPWIQYSVSLAALRVLYRGDIRRGVSRVDAAERVAIAAERVAIAAERVACRGLGCRRTCRRGAKPGSRRKVNTRPSAHEPHAAPTATHAPAPSDSLHGASCPMHWVCMLDTAPPLTAAVGGGRSAHGSRGSSRVARAWSALGRRPCPRGAPVGPRLRPPVALDRLRPLPCVQYPNASPVFRLGSFAP